MSGGGGGGTRADGNRSVIRAVVGAMTRIEERPVPAPPLVVPVATFEELYIAEYRPMVRLAFILVRADGAAEEVVQDAFARVFERWSSLDNPGGYLRTCVVNRARDVVRRQRLARWRQPYLSSPYAELGADHLGDALDRLPAKRRAAIVLRYYADLSEAEIAEALGVRPGTVKSMLHRGIAQLREAIQ